MGFLDAVNLDTMDHYETYVCVAGSVPRIYSKNSTAMCLSKLNAMVTHEHPQTANCASFFLPLSIQSTPTVELQAMSHAG